MQPRPRRRTERRQSDARSLENALDIVELLARRPSGLTVLEIVGHLPYPTDEVISTIATLQQRRWLRTHAAGGGLTLGHRLVDLAIQRQSSDAD